MKIYAVKNIITNQGKYKMSQENTLSQLRYLKLTGMTQAFTEQIEQPPIQNLSFEERFAMLVDREILARGNRRIQNLLRSAKLRQQACIENMDYLHPRNLNKSQFNSLMTCDFIRQHHNLIITGPTGCGKSYLACVVGHQACRQGLSVKYIRLPRFLEELSIAHADGSYGKLLGQILKVDLLIFDDFALEPALNPEQRRDLFTIIEDRHQLKSTLITSQLPVKHWHDYIGEPTTADAILDRLLEKTHRIEMNGESMRKNKLLD
jgi:DNA replication protein DnaC